MNNDQNPKVLRFLRSPLAKASSSSGVGSVAAATELKYNDDVFTFDKGTTQARDQPRGSSKVKFVECHENWRQQDSRSGNCKSLNSRPQNLGGSKKQTMESSADSQMRNNSKTTANGVRRQAPKSSPIPTSIGTANPSTGKTASKGYHQGLGTVQIRDDQVLMRPSTLGESGFIRGGGGRRSLQLPNNRPTVQCRPLTGITSVTTAKNRNPRSYNINGNINLDKISAGQASPKSNVQPVSIRDTSTCKEKLGNQGDNQEEDGGFIEESQDDDFYKYQPDLNLNPKPISPKILLHNGRLKTGITDFVSSTAPFPRTSSLLQSRNNVHQISSGNRKTSALGIFNNGGSQLMSPDLVSGELDRDIDAASDVSETPSTFSVNGSTMMADVMVNLVSSSSALRKEGLSDLQYLLRSGAVLSKKDLKRISEIFTRMFHEPQTKVFGLFMEVLVDLIHNQADDLREWIPMCLSRLLSKLDADLLGSVQIKIQRALETIRFTLPYDQQLFAFNQIIGKPAQINSTKVKKAVLNHLHKLLLSMNPSDISSGDDNLLLWSQIINWSMETKSTDTCRRSAQKLIISLFNLNPPIFSLVLTKQPKSSQDFVQRILHSHLMSTTNSIEEEDEVQVATAERQVCHSTASKLGSIGHLKFGQKITRSQQPSINNRAYSEGDGYNPNSGQEDIPKRREHKINRPENLKVNRYSKDSGIYFGSDETKDEVFSPEPKNWPNAAENETGLFNCDQTATSEVNDREQIQKIKSSWCSDFSGYADTPGKLYTVDCFPREEELFLQHGQWSDIVNTFSNPKSSEQKRKQAMQQLMCNFPGNYKDVTETSLITMLKVLLLTAEGTDDVSDLADECISLLLEMQTPEKRIQILKDVADKADFPANLSALRLQYAELQKLELVDICAVLSELVPSLLRAYENNESKVRKASLFCLVYLYTVIREDIWNYINNINENKKNVLLMYFKRTSVQKRTATN